MGTATMDDFGGQQPHKLPPEVVRNLPFKQRLTVEFGPRLEYVLKRFSHISYRLEDAVLATNISDLFQKIGFKSHPQPEQQVKVLIHNIIKWIDNQHLVLLHFKPKHTSYNLIHLLREIKTTAPSLPLHAFIPVFIGSVTSQRQLEVFKLLGAFGIRYGLFLTPGISLEQNAEEIIDGLSQYCEILRRDGADVGVVDAPAAGGDNPEKVRMYKELMRKGEEMMRDGRYGEAIDFFSEAIALGPNFHLLMERGEAYYKSKKFMPALNDFREASKMEKSAADPYAKIGARCFSMVKESAATEGPAKAEKWFQMGMKYLREADTMVVQLEKHRGIAPEKAPPFPYAAILSALAETDIRGLGFPEMEEEIASFSTNLLSKVRTEEDAISDNSVDTRVDRALLLTRYRQYDEAEKIFREVVEEDPEQVGPAFNNFAVELRKNEQYEKAFQIYMELLRYKVPDRDIVVENFKMAGLKFATALKEKMKYEESVAALNNILMNDPRGKEWVLCELAATYLEMQNQAQASFRFMEALYVNPKLMQSEKFAPYRDLGNLRQEMIKKLTESGPGKQIR